MVQCHALEATNNHAWRCEVGKTIQGRIPEGCDVGSDEGAIPAHALAQHPLQRGNLVGEGGGVGDAVGVAAQKEHGAATAQLDVQAATSQLQ